jgi:hypothetical protein
LLFLRATALAAGFFCLALDVMQTCGHYVGRDLAGEPEVEWMYADARFLPLPGLGSLAEANPFRWSRGTPDKIVLELERVAEGWWNSDRPVRVRVVGQHYSHKFSTAKDAAQVLHCSLWAMFAIRQMRS